MGKVIWEGGVVRGSDGGCLELLVVMKIVRGSIGGTLVLGFES